MLKLHIFKYNPLDCEDKPKLQTYEIEETPGMTIFVALNFIRDKLDHTLQFDFVCRAGICGSCAMVINGVPTLGCKTLTSSYESGEITLLTLHVFKLIGDLSIDTANWMKDMSKEIQSWIHTNEVTNINKIEKPMEPEVADDVFELDRCIECGCCIAACGTKRMRPKFKGAVALNRITRFAIDPRDNRSMEDMFEIIGDDEGVFGCMSLLGCDDTCPKHLPLQTKIAYLRRQMVKVK